MQLEFTQFSENGANTLDERHLLYVTDLKQKIVNKTFFLTKSSDFLNYYKIPPI